jgi:hypothetical protein
VGAAGRAAAAAAGAATRRARSAHTRCPALVRQLTAGALRCIRALCRAWQCPTRHGHSQFKPLGVSRTQQWAAASCSCRPVLSGACGLQGGVGLIGSDRTVRAHALPPARSFRAERSLDHVRPTCCFLLQTVTNALLCVGALLLHVWLQSAHLAVMCVCDRQAHTTTTHTHARTHARTQMWFNQQAGQRTQRDGIHQCMHVHTPKTHRLREQRVSRGLTAATAQHQGKNVRVGWGQAVELHTCTHAPVQLRQHGAVHHSKSTNSTRHNTLQGWPIGPLTC